MKSGPLSSALCLSKTEKIVIFSEGGATSSSTTSGGATSMARDTAGTMLQSFEAIKEAVGLDIPRMLKDVSTGGLVGKCQSPIPADSKGTTDQDADVRADD